MVNGFRRTLALTSLLAVAATPHARGDDDSVVLLRDGFGDLRPGMLSSVVGAHTEYHYLPVAAPKGNWSVSTFRSQPESQRAWRVIEDAGSAAMLQAWQNNDAHCRPMLVTGKELWRDYRVEMEFVPLKGRGRSGIAFRCRNDRCYYFFGVEDRQVAGQQVVLKLVHHGEAYRKPYEKTLAQQEFQWKPGTALQATIQLNGSHIRASIAPGVEMEFDDETYRQGGIGLTSDFPTIFRRVEVTSFRQAHEELIAEIARRDQQERELQSQNPRPTLWRKISTPGFGVGRNLRFGDLDGDGTIDILIGQPRHHGPKDRNSEVRCLTAMTMEGEQLWQIGEPDPWADHLTNDVAVQIHDFDGDGKSEVIYAMGQRIVVADGATGKQIRSAATPKTPPTSKPPYNRFPRILGDAAFFCDLRGTGRAADLIIKDRYSTVWALDESLDVMWQAHCNTGHYPYAADVDDDGRDELMMGYTLFDDDGRVLWTLEDRLQDHADGVALVRFLPDREWRLLCAASDEGMVFSDIAGNILKHHYLGHVQNPAVADFRPELPGLESVSINFWGNQGIVHFYDANGEIYHDAEPCQHGSMCLPINWTGKPGEYFVLSADVREGGLFDGWCRRAVQFPADGHPDMCNAVLDITGDCRDEIVVWDPHEIWIYTQSDSPLPGRLYKPRRNPLYNYSNYQVTVSLPGWSEEQ